MEAYYGADGGSNGVDAGQLLGDGGKLSDDSAAGGGEAQTVWCGCLSLAFYQQVYMYNTTIVFCCCHRQLWSCWLLLLSLLSLLLLLVVVRVVGMVVLLWLLLLLLSFFPERRVSQAPKPPKKTFRPSQREPGGEVLSRMWYVGLSQVRPWACERVLDNLHLEGCHSYSLVRAS